MPDAPRFSVTIPAYNAAATLAETVRSVQVQTFSDWELVIVDDGSTDDTLRIAEDFAAEDGRIRVVSQENRGSGGAYNTAVRAARSDLLVMLSADDLLFPGHLAAFDKAVSEHPSVSIFTCDGYFQFENGSRAPQDLNRGWANPDKCTMPNLLNACFYGIGAVYRREVFESVGGFREDVYAEDYIFWLFAFAAGFEHLLVDEPLSVHRRNVTQKSAAVLKMRDADVHAIEAVVASGLLEESDRGLAERVIVRHRRNIAVRRALGAVLGEHVSSSLLSRVGVARRAAGPRGSE